MRWRENRAGFDATHPHSYFVPMVDMLAGVVFLLVILLVANAHVSRPGFQTEAAARQEITRIEAELAAARAAEQTVLRPRRQAQRAAQILLEKLRRALGEAGIPSTVLAGEQRLVIRNVTLWQDGRFLPSSQAQRLASAVGRILASDLGCLAPRPVSEPGMNCSEYPPAKLDEISLGVRPASQRPEEQRTADVQSLVLLTEVVRSYPFLLSLHAPDADALVKYDGLPALPDQAGGDSVEIRLQFDLPPVP